MSGLSRNGLSIFRNDSELHRGRFIYWSILYNGHSARGSILSLLVPLKFQNVTSDILFILILVELFRLLIIYLQEQRISVGVAVEVSNVSVLREVIIRGVLEIPWQQILAICAFLLVLAALLLTRAWMAQIFNTTKNKLMLKKTELC